MRASSESATENAAPLAANQLPAAHTNGILPGRRNIGSRTKPGIRTAVSAARRRRRGASQIPPTPNSRSKKTQMNSEYIPRSCCATKQDRLQYFTSVNQPLELEYRAPSPLTIRPFTTSRHTYTTTFLLPVVSSHANREAKIGHQYPLT